LPDGGLAIRWDDGHRSTYGGQSLRLACRCALCEDEWTSERRITAGSVPSDVALLETRPVGRYGLQLDWSDGHNTGIYTFDRLRELCECDACRTRSGL
jgi:DUF971 family protein